MAQFVQCTKRGLEELIDRKDSRNTKRATKNAVKIFWTYLEEKGNEPIFENYTKLELDSVLSKF